MPDNKRQKTGPDPRKVDPKGKTKPVAKSGPRGKADFSRKTSPKAEAVNKQEDGTERRRTQTWEITRLRTHPRQSVYFKLLSGKKLRELADNMKKEGLKVPVEILPDGTIICGHSRVEAAKQLGWETIEVIVRYDLAERGEAAVEMRLIEDNLHRRQLSPLAQARAFQRLKELGRRRPADNLSHGERVDLRDRLGEEFGMSGRNSDRYLAVLRTLPAVQDAFDRGDLPLALAAQVASLAQEVQAQIANEIEAGRPPKEVVREHLARSTNSPKAARTAYHRLLRALEAGNAELDGRANEIGMKAADGARRISILERSASLIEQLRCEEEAVRERYEAMIREIEEMRRQMGLSE
jgi:ParB family chromosome partitioning protein